MVKDIDSLDDIKEKAKIVAEATGRDEAKVLQDLLDDGIANLSNEIPKDSLVEQLKEAAELITTVQSINKEVADNTVLNGGENSTEVLVETTLEGDIVDRAIASVHRKAENIKKIALILIPTFLLLTGGTMEGFGVINIFGSDESQHNGEDICAPDWAYDDYSYSNEDTIHVSFSFYDGAECGHELEGHFITYIFKVGESSNFDASHHNVGYFVNGVDVNFEINGLEGGDYWIQYEFHDLECEGGGCLHGDEWFSPHTPHFTIEEVGCDAYLINEQVYILESNPKKVRISADVDLVEGQKNCDKEQFEITWRLYQETVVKYENKTYESGIVLDPDGADYTSYTWDDISEGTYSPKVILKLNGEILDEKWLAHTINIEAEPIYGCTDDSATNYDSMATEDDGSCEFSSENQYCEINLYNIAIITNSTHTTVTYDLDCGYEENDLIGYNVSIQFLVFNISSSNTSSEPIVWESVLSYIQGWQYDNESITLTNFTANNTTHYDFCFYATWIDGTGELQYIERKWLNRELNP